MSRRKTVVVENDEATHADDALQFSPQVEKVAPHRGALRGSRSYYGINAPRPLVAAHRRASRRTDEHKLGPGKNASLSPQRLSHLRADSADSDWSDDDSVDIQFRRYIRRDQNAGPQPQPYPVEPEVRPKELNDIQTVCDPEHPKDITVHLDLPITDDIDLELEKFARLRRMGDFKGAKEFFKQHLDEHITRPYVLVQYAEMLMDMGDYNSFANLNPDPVLRGDLARPTAADTGSGDSENERLPREPIYYVRHRRPHPPGSSALTARVVKWADNVTSQDGRRKNEAEDLPGHSNRSLNSSRVREREQIKRGWHNPSEPETLPAQYPAIVTNSKCNELQLLGWNWRLLNALARIHGGGSLNEAVNEASTALRELKFGPDMGSTEVQLISLTLQICGHIQNCVPDVFATSLRAYLDNWVNFADLYMLLLSQDRVWDFRDLVCAAFTVFGPKHWETMTKGQIDETILGDFAHDIDEVTCLALLDLLVSTTLELELSAEEPNGGVGSAPTAQSLAESIMKDYPESMRSRTFMRWILIKAAQSSLKEESGLPDSFQELFRHLESFSGMTFFRRDWITLPIYVPKGSEIPPWRVPEVPTEANEPVQIVMKLAKDLDDYPTQVLCYKLLLLRSQETTALFQELLNLQKTVQHDRSGYLQTCLSSYIGCTDRQSQRQLLDDLSDMEEWDGDSEIRDAEMYWAKDFIQRALASKMNSGRRQQPQELSSADISYYGWLPNRARQFVNKALGIDHTRHERFQSHTRPRNPDPDHQHALKREHWQPNHDRDWEELKRLDYELARFKKDHVQEHEDLDQRHKTQPELANMEIKQRERPEAKNRSISTAPGRKRITVRPRTAMADSAPASRPLNQGPSTGHDCQHRQRKDGRPLASSSGLDALHEINIEEGPIDLNFAASNTKDKTTSFGGWGAGRNTGNTWDLSDFQATDSTNKEEEKIKSDFWSINRPKPKKKTTLSFGAFDEVEETREGAVNQNKQHARPQEMQIVPWASRSYHVGNQIEAEDHITEIEGDNDVHHAPYEESNDEYSGRAVQSRASKEDLKHEAKSADMIQPQSQSRRAEKKSLGYPERPDRLDGIPTNVQTGSTGVWDMWDEMIQSESKSRLPDTQNQAMKRSGGDSLKREQLQGGKRSPAPTGGLHPEQDLESSGDKLHNAVDDDTFNPEEEWGLSSIATMKDGKKKKQREMHDNTIIAEDKVITSPDMTEKPAKIATKLSAPGGGLQDNSSICGVKMTKKEKQKPSGIMWDEPETSAAKSQTSGDDIESLSTFQTTQGKPKQERRRASVFDNGIGVNPIEATNITRKITQIQDAQEQAKRALMEERGGQRKISTAEASAMREKIEDGDEPTGPQMNSRGSDDLDTPDLRPSRRPTIDEVSDLGEGHERQAEEN